MIDYTTWTAARLEKRLAALDEVLTHLDEFRALPAEVAARQLLEAQYDAIEAELDRRADERMHRALDVLAGVRLTLDE